MEGNKTEPLKGKILLWNGTTGDIETTDGKYFLMTKAENGKYVEILLKSDVQSAVEGLFREIFIEVKNATQLINDGNAEVRKVGYAYLDGLKFSIEKIKRWFPDVFEDERK